MDRFRYRFYSFRQFREQLEIEELGDACYRGDCATVSQILGRNRSLDINRYDWDGHTALHDAIMWNKTEVVKILLDHPRTRLDLLTRFGKTVIHGCCVVNYVESLSLLTKDKRCTPDILNMKTKGKDGVEMTALMIAICFGSVECVRVLVELPGTDIGPVTVAGGKKLTMKQLALNCKKHSCQVDKNKYDNIVKLLGYKNIEFPEALAMNGK